MYQSLRRFLNWLRSLTIETNLKFLCWLIFEDYQMKDIHKYMF